jgi:hypothetical protein
MYVCMCVCVYVYQDIVRRVKQSTGTTDANVIHELESALAMERRAAEHATREKNELIARMSKVFRQFLYKKSKICT